MADFEFDAEKYRQASTHQREWGSRVITELKLRGNEWILDLGCGDGGLTAQLARRVPRGRVVGIDCSENMIAAAAKHAAVNLSFRRVDMSAMGFTGQFDLAFSNAALQWVKDHQDLLQRVYRALRSGGQIRFNFAADGNCSHFIAVVREVMQQDAFRPYFAGFDWPWFMPRPEDYEWFVRWAGFTRVEVWGENADRHFRDAAEMIRWINQPSLVPFLACLPEPHRPAFRDKVISGMLAACEQPDGTCFETFRRVNIIGFKPVVNYAAMVWRG